MKGGELKARKGTPEEKAVEANENAGKPLRFRHGKMSIFTRAAAEGNGGKAGPLLK